MGKLQRELCQKLIAVSRSYSQKTGPGDGHEGSETDKELVKEGGYEYVSSLPEDRAVEALQ